MKNLKFPKEFDTLLPVIKNSEKPIIKIRLKKAKTELHQCKVGGDPWFPRTMTYPEDSQGKPLVLLAQLNFAHMPLLPGFPKEGILQFFISGNDDVFGMNFDDATVQKDFRVIFHDKAEAEELMSGFPSVSGEFLPFESECLMEFYVDTEPVSPSDYRLEDVFPDMDFPDCLGEKASDFYCENCSGEGHKCGGYGYFTQSDPRDYGMPEHSDLLLQLDSDFDAGLCWGDSGVAGFFITPDDLKKRDFSRVLYNWDCY